jgi:signal peptidase I
MNDFEWVGSYADFLAEEEAQGGAAVRVSDGTMEPVLFEGDIVRVEKLEATEDDVICVQVGNGHVFGYRTANALRRLQGPDVPLAGNEHVVGVATAVIDREVKPRRRGQTK